MLAPSIPHVVCALQPMHCLRTLSCTLSANSGVFIAGSSIPHISGSLVCALLVPLARALPAPFILNIACALSDPTNVAAL
ncbi:hypothetical protein GGH92_005092 [Coemansia sp. RSA 2673]|nr:hypothetical protein GGH92_005092 [Coemansia sp. RSA 2673]